MDILSKLDFKFLNLDDLDENDQSEIIDILVIGIASSVLKLPWTRKEKDYNANSVVTEVPEEPQQWQNYNENIATYEMADPTGSMMTPQMSRSMPYPTSYVPFYPTEWQLSNPYPNGATPDANVYQVVPYGGPMYPTQANEVLSNPSPSHEPDRRRGSNRSRKNDNYNQRIVNSVEMRSNYMMQQGQYNPIPAMCHSAMSYMTYSVQSQPHPAAGRPIFMRPHQYTQPPPIQHNSHAQYNHPNYQQPTHQHSSQTVKQHLRQQNQHCFTSEMSKTHQSTQKSERKSHDVSQQFRHPLNNSESDFQKRKYLGANTVNTNGHVAVKNQAVVSKKLEKNEAIKNVETKVELVAEVKKEAEEIKVPAPKLDEQKVEKQKIEEPKVEKVTTSSNVELKKVIEPSIEVKVNGDVSLKAGNIEILEQAPVKAVQLPANVSSLTTSPVPVPVQVQVTAPAVTPAPASAPASATAPAPPAPFSFASVVKKGTDQLATVDHRQPSKFVNVEVAHKTSHQGQHDKHEQASKRPSAPQNDLSTKTVVEKSFNGRKKSPNKVTSTMNNQLGYQMGEFLLNYQMDKQTISLLPRGLTNRSNYCYINSILQALLACPPFFNLLRALASLRQPSQNSSTPLIDNMIKFVCEFSPLPPNARLAKKDLRAKKNKSGATAVDIQGGNAFEPSYVYTMLKNTSCPGVFSIEGRQEDAEEFLSCLLNGISDEMLELMKQVGDDSNAPSVEEPVVNYGSDDEEWKVMGPKNKGSITRCTEFGRTPLSDIFRGQLRSRILRVGDQSTDNVQPFFTLQLDIEKAKSVEAALDILVDKDQVEGLTCSKTKQQIEAWKQVTFEELPVVLILHLKWFDYKLDGCSKIVKNVSYAIDLKVDNKILSPNAAKKLTNRQRQYKLFAVTYHDGKEATKGHYVTDAYHVSFGAWVRYDDSSVKGVSEHDVLNPSPPRVPYLLYYRRCDTIGNNQPNNSRSR